MAQLRWNHSFRDILDVAADGTIRLDYRKFDEIERSRQRVSSLKAWEVQRLDIAITLNDVRYPGPTIRSVEVAMHPFPHHYVVTATARPSGDVPLAAEGLRVIESAMPKEFDGPGNQWSPESLLVAAVADCFVLSFRAVAVGFKFSWISLDVRTEGTVERSDGKMRFTKFLTHAKLRIAAGGDADKAKRLLEKAEASCLVTNSLSSDVHLTTEVTSG